MQWLRDSPQLSFCLTETRGVDSPETIHVNIFESCVEYVIDIIQSSFHAHTQNHSRDSSGPCGRCKHIVSQQPSNYLPYDTEL